MTKGSPEALGSHPSPTIPTIVTAPRDPAARPSAYLSLAFLPFPTMRFRWIVPVAGALLAGAGCEGGSGAIDPEPGITLTLARNELVPGDTVAVRVQRPGNEGCCPGLVLHSSNPSALAISGYTVIALAPGQATLTATMGSATSSVTATVFPDSVTSVELSQATVPQNGALLLAPVAKGRFGGRMRDVAFTYSSSDSNVVRVDSLGVAEARSPGTAILRVAAGAQVGSAAITVSPVPLPIRLIMDRGLPVPVRLQAHAAGVRWQRMFHAGLPDVDDVAGSFTTPCGAAAPGGDLDAAEGIYVVVAVANLPGNAAGTGGG